MEKVALAAAVLAWIVFACVGMWEITSPLAEGHNAAGAAFVVGGEEMVRWKMFATVFNYFPQKPGPENIYAHHPWGLTIISALIYKIIGHGWVATRLPAVIFSAFTPPLLYRVGRALWGIVPSSIASIVFVLVPIDMAFSNFWNLEVPTIFFGLVFTLGTVRFWQTWKPRAMWLSVLGAFLVAQIDWDGDVLVAAFVLFSFVRAYVVPRSWFGRLREREHARWFAFVVAVTVGTVLFYIAVFSKDGRMQDLLDSYTNRTTGSETPFFQVMKGRRLMWLYWMLTPLGLWTGGLGLLVAFGRLLSRDALGVVAPAWAAAAAFEYFVFKQGADTHIFWPHVASVAIALGAGLLATALLDARVRTIERAPSATRERTRRWTAIATGVVLVVPVALMARTAFPLLWQARLTAGRFDEGGRTTESERGKSLAMQWTAAPLPRTASVVIPASFALTQATIYAADRPLAGIDKLWDSIPKDVVEGAFLLDARKLTASELRSVGNRYAVKAAGPYWRIDRTAPAAPFAAFRYEERFAVGLERLGLATDLIRTISREEDPWASWEWRVHLGQAAPLPTAEPVTFEDMRAAHNAAVVRGDTARASALRASLEAQLTHPSAYEYTDDLHLVGMRLEVGPPQVMTLLWYAGAAYVPTDVRYIVRSRVVERPLLWPTIIDPNEKLASSVPALAPSMWRRSFLYTQRFVIQERIGTERFYGQFLGNADTVTPPSRTDGAPNVQLVTF